MTTRLDRIEDSLEKTGTLVNELAITSAKTDVQIANLKYIAERHMKNDAIEHANMRKDIKSNGNKLMYFSGGLATIVIVGGYVLKVLSTT